MSAQRQGIATLDYPLLENLLLPEACLLWGLSLHLAAPPLHSLGAQQGRLTALLMSLGGRCARSVQQPWLSSGTQRHPDSMWDASRAIVLPMTSQPVFDGSSRYADKHLN
jgi:hypothetical protein